MGVVVPFPKAPSRLIKIRWAATVTYRTEKGPWEIVHQLEELAELHDLIEQGPDWDTIMGVSIERLNPNTPGLTVEQSMEPA